MSRKSEVIGLIIVALAFIVIIQYQKAGRKYTWEKDLDHRVAVDFSKTKEEVKTFIAEYIPNVTDEQIDKWTREKKLEGRVINGEMRYFGRTARNLFRVDPELGHIFDSVEAAKVAARIAAGETVVEEEESNVKNLPEIIFGVKANSSGSHFAAPKRMRIRYSITVNPGAVPAGKMIRCWLPYPRTDIARQGDVKFISAGVHDLTITDPTDKRLVFSHEKTEHNSLYMQSMAIAGKPTTFFEEFEYTSSGEWYDLENMEILPYDTTTEMYKEYTSEREAHVIFTPELKALADSITKGLDNPYQMAKAIFDFIDPYPWAGALEYSTIPNIPMYVYDIKHGDCGQQSLLFITLCRIKGIPAHFQSGFMMHPSGWNLHDWSEIYLEGIGWVPVDMSFGKPEFAVGDYLEKWPESKYFFLGGIDSWRMVVNTDFGKEFYPKKKFPRSETVDFQRGEVEWAKGNVYFDQWDYNMEIEYLN